MTRDANCTVREPIGYTNYHYDPEKLGDRARFDPDCLEETNMGPLRSEFVDYIEQEFPGSVGDSDGDGYLEMDRYAVEMAAAELGLKGSLPLAALFVDDPPSTVEDEDMYTYDFVLLAAQSYYPMSLISWRLDQYLDWIGVHIGNNSDVVLGIADDVTLASTSGFSMDNRGRMRIDCKIFVQLAYESLKQIPGLMFYEIELDDGGDSLHAKLLVTDGNGNNMLVNNGFAFYFRSRRPQRWIAKKERRSYCEGTIKKVGSKERPWILFERNCKPRNKDGY